MRIYYTPELDWLSHQGFEPENVYLFFNEGLMTCLNQGQIDYLGYSTDKNYHNFLNLASEPLLYVIDKKTKQGELMTKNGEVYNAVPEPFNSQPALTKTSPCNTLLYVRLSEYNGQKDVSVTLKEGKLAVKPLLFSIIYKVTSNSIYGLDRQRRNILKTDSNLDTLWSYELEYESDYGTAKDALFHNQTLINFIGAREETFERTDRDVFEQYRGGALIALDTDTGQLKWQFECETYLDNYQLDQGRLYYGAHDGVRILDPDTGELLQFIASGLPEPKNHPRFLCSVFVDKSYIYFCYSELGRWYVYDKHSYQLLTTLQLPEHCVPWRHIFTDNKSGKHYFYLSDYTKYVDRSYLFELDPSNLLAPIEFETKPRTEVAFAPVNGEANNCDLLITLYTPRLDDALRFGEIITRDLALQHGRSKSAPDMYIRQFERHPDKRFNGTIRLQVVGCQADPSLINERLVIMAQRFATWNHGFHTCLYGHAKNAQGKVNLATLYAQSVSEQELGTLTSLQPQPKNDLPQAPKIPVEDALMDYLTDYENGEFSTDDTEYLAEALAVSNQVITGTYSTKLIGSAYFLQALYYLAKEEGEQRRKALKEAAQCGNTNAMIESLFATPYQEWHIDLLALAQVYNQQGTEFWNIQADVESCLEKQDAATRSRIDTHAQEIQQQWDSEQKTPYWIF